MGATSVTAVAGWGSVCVAALAGAAVLVNCLLALTPAGESVYRDLRSVAEEYDSHLARQFTRGEEALLRMMLRRLAGMG